jgi:hypothetical protein
MKPSNLQPAFDNEAALQWWDTLGLFERVHTMNQFGIDSHRSTDSLTRREIELIWKNELCLSAYGVPMWQVDDDDVAFIIKEKNHKVPTITENVFDESKFKEYISKFSNDDKLRMLSILSCEISTVNPILNDLLNRVSSYGGTKLI